MHGLSSVDPGCNIDWGKTSGDYGRFRPGPPDSFYQRLFALGIGLPQQDILDLGTGTGVLARRFAQQGARVSGIDLFEEQIKMARELAREESLDVDFRTSPAENTPFNDRQFDVITANQCWLYFKKDEVIAEVKRLLKPGGVLVTSHFSWLPRLDSIAKKTEELVLKFNPNWTAAGWNGDIPPMPKWAEGKFILKGMFFYDEPIPFTRESWCGRIRACRGVGAALPDNQVKEFDAEHMRLLEKTAPSQFTVLHRLDAHILQPVI
jgi:SAM-dependent methyltransferase